MPIYEYRCKKCGDFERMQRITDAPLPRCPTCRGKVTKLISNTSFQLKGSGWYATDYGRKDSTGGKETKKESKSESASSSDSTTTEKKPATEKTSTKAAKEAAAA